jgi:hypothetical protein
MKSLPAIVLSLISAILLSCDKGAPKAEPVQIKLKTTYVVNETGTAPFAVQTPEKEPIKKNRKL